MSAFDFIHTTITEITDFLKVHSIELKLTKYQDTYLVKFTPTTDITHPDINRIKGLIFNHKTGEIISMTYPVPVEVKDFEPTRQQEILTHIAEQQYVVQEALDGTLFRYSYLDEKNEWILSTNSKEDADEAFWMNGISLAKQFESVNRGLINLETLNKKYIYMFVMCHPLNVIVVNHSESKIYHVATYDRTTLSEIDHDIGLPQPQKLELSVNELMTKMSEAKTKPVSSAGYMVLVKNNGSNHRYRFENSNYTRAKEIRGNSNNIDYTILSLYEQGGEALVKEFLSYYPIYQSEHNLLITKINKLTGKLYREYGSRYKDHKDFRVHPRHHKFLAEIHQIVYRDTLQPIGKTVQYSNIQTFLLSQPPAKLLYLVNYIYDQDNNTK